MVGGRVVAKKGAVEDDDSDLGEGGRSDVKSDIESEDEVDRKDDGSPHNEGEESEDEEDWEQFKQESQKERVQSLETKSQIPCSLLPIFPRKKAGVMVVLYSRHQETVVDISTIHGNVT
jgi:hypothetical protein